MNTNTVRKFFSEARISFGVFFILMIILGSIIWQASRWGTETRMANLLTRHYLGEQVATPDMALTVESIRRDTVGAPPLVPLPGDEFVVATISLQNNTNKQFDLMPLLYFYLKDKAGNVYTVVAVPSTSNQISGPILPHDKLREEVGFEVAKNAQDLRLYFDPGLTHNNVISVDLRSSKT